MLAVKGYLFFMLFSPVNGRFFMPANTPQPFHKKQDANASCLLLYTCS